jgi:biotin transporter BioY
MQIGVFAFIPGDVLKAVLIVFLVEKIRPLRGEFK